MVSKYAPLSEYLLTLPQESERITLSFAEIETILHFSLPPSARTRVEWWANTETHSHGHAWLDVGWKTTNIDLHAERVSFFRISLRNDGAPQKIEERGHKYEPLFKFFSRLPSTQKQIALSFHQIEKILNSPLPRSAKERQEWWGNSEEGRLNSKTWLEAGWRTERVFLLAQIVVFHRRGDDALRRINRYVQFLLEGGHSLSHPSVETRLRWLRICRQIGWFFQGTVIYERGPALSAEAEEDYEECKRELSRYSAK